MLTGELKIACLSVAVLLGFNAVGISKSPPDRNPSISNPAIKLILSDKTNNYSLDKIVWRGTEFNCAKSGEFPTFKLIKGKEASVLSPESKDLVSGISSRRKDRISVVYDCLGSKVEVSYRLLPEGVKIEFKILKEGEYKFISVQSKEGFVLVSRNSLSDISGAKIVVPVRQGLQIGFSDKKGVYFSSEGNPFGLWGSIDSFGGWVMNANFASLIKADAGMIIRPAEHSGKFLYGVKDLNGEEQMFLDVPCYFRPIQTATDEMPLLHNLLSVDIAFFGDENGDGEVDWVDVGIFYRDKYIKFCRNVDADVKDAVIGKLHAGTGYDNLLASIKRVYFAPQIWWLTGAHVKNDECYDQNWWVFGPEASLGDYLKLKDDAKKYKARIGVHQNLDDVYQDEGWNAAEVRKMPDGQLWKGGIWGGRQAYLRDVPGAERNKSLYRRLDDWFSIWDVRRADTWHYDVFAAVELMEDYDLNDPATREMDFCSRRDILEYVSRKGIKVTSEMAVEGLHEWLSFGLQNAGYYHYSELLESTWEIAKEIPLYPVLFLGRVYVGDLGRPAEAQSLSYAEAMLLGAKRVGWFSAVPVEVVEEAYFKQNVFWSQICDLSVKDVNETENGYAVIYSDNSELAVDMQKDEFSYKKDGVIYKDFSPFNSFGYMGIWVNPYNIHLKERNFVRSVSKGARHICAFNPDGTLEVYGAYVRKNLAVLKKIPFAVYPEKRLTAELVEEGKLEDGRVRYAFRMQSDGRQKVAMHWQSSAADWLDGRDDKYIGRDKDKLNVEIDGEMVLVIEIEK